MGGSSFYGNSPQAPGAPPAQPPGSSSSDSTQAPSSFYGNSPQAPGPPPAQAPGPPTTPSGDTSSFYHNSPQAPGPAPAQAPGPTSFGATAAPASFYGQLGAIYEGLVPSSDGSVTDIRIMTQAAYDALNPPDATTLYVIIF